MSAQESQSLKVAATNRYCRSTFPNPNVCLLAKVAVKNKKRIVTRRLKERSSGLLPTNVKLARKWGYIYICMYICII